MPRPAMVVRDGNLRPATDGEIADLETREIMSWELRRMPGRGKEGLERLLAHGGSPGNASGEGYLLTCTCGHLFLDDLPGQVSP